MDKYKHKVEDLNGVLHTRKERIAVLEGPFKENKTTITKLRTYLAISNAKMYTESLQNLLLKKEMNCHVDFVRIKNE